MFQKLLPHVRSSLTILTSHCWFLYYYQYYHYHYQYIIVIIIIINLVLLVKQSCMSTRSEFFPSLYLMTMSKPTISITLSLSAPFPASHLRQYLVFKRAINRQFSYSRYWTGASLQWRLMWGNINLLLTEREGRTGEYWPEVVAVRTERSEVRAKTTEGQYSSVRLELARLVSSLLYGWLGPCLFWIFRLSKTKKYTAYGRFHGNSPYGEIPARKEPIRTLGSALPYNNDSY